MEETETTNLWNKKTTELTVGDIVVISLVSPILAVGGLMLIGGVLTSVDWMRRKIRKSGKDDQTETPEEK